MPTSHITVRVGEQQADGSWLITDARWPASRFKAGAAFGYDAQWWNDRLMAGPTFQTQAGTFRIPTTGA